MNPFLDLVANKKFNNFDDAFPFDQLKPEHFLPGVDAGVETARAILVEIKNVKQPNFENVIVALDSATDCLEITNLIYGNMFAAEGTDAIQALAGQLMPKVAAFSSEMTLDEKLFEKIKAVKDSVKPGQLTAEQSEMLDRYYRNFVRNGANLPPEKKERLKQIDQELSVLSPKFSENVLGATNAFSLTITNKKDLAGLPESAIEAAHMEAEKRGLKDQWVFTLQGPSYVPFLQYCSNAELRKKMWIAYNSRSFNDKFDNQDLIKQSLKLK